MRIINKLVMACPILAIALGVACSDTPTPIVDCLTNANCDGGKICDLSVHRCVPPCASADDCAQPAGLCQTAVCVNEVCGLASVALGTEVEDTPGDCRVTTCDGNGAAIDQSKPSDKPVVTEECMIGACQEGAPKTAPKAAGEPCGSSGVCNGSGACGVCIPNDLGCDGSITKACNGDGQWVNGDACVGSTPICLAGACAPPPSCQGLATLCGKNGDSCCASVKIDEGKFPMGRGLADAEPGGWADEKPEINAHVLTFYLDVYPVTVGRFRKFVAAYQGASSLPAKNAGAKPGVEGSGWNDAWKSSMPVDKSSLLKDLKDPDMLQQTWTDAPGQNEDKPIVGITWFEAFAFCVWDGGRLPTEAEWEYAAAGGELNRKYPWGAAPPDLTRASYDCGLDGAPDCSAADIAHVGSLPDGNGLWGNADLAGNAGQWVLDEYDSAWYMKHDDQIGCDNCANVEFQSTRIARGGTWLSDPLELRAAYRGSRAAATVYADISVRCARDP